MLNHTMSIFISCRIGKKIGTMMTTIGTHSSGQPRMKHTTRIARIRKVGGIFHSTSVLAMKVGVPSAENTEPMKVEATSRIITMLEVCTVRNTESLNTAQVSLAMSRGHDQRAGAAERCALGRRRPARDD